jgi:16S rRNA (uracil1498-N3)-methyltransferase
LFVDEPLREGAVLTLGDAPANYLGNVLRLQPGAQVKLFDNRTGEWLAQITDVAKKRITLVATRLLRPREPVPDIWLVFAPIKKGRIDWLIEKATEVGAARLVPAITQRTIVDKLNLDRLRAHTVEAAEQCERTALPELAEPVKLAALLRAWPAERTLFFADENGGEPFAAAAAGTTGPAAILIGPEGGFTPDEAAAIRALPQARPVSLGPRVLRAETAAVAALSVWMAATGDWREPVAR